MEPSMIFPVTEQPKQNIIRAVQEYGKRLFHFIRGRVDSREDAEDILQDVWYQFSNVINSEPIEQTSAWLFKVARNKIIDQYRKQKTDSFEEPISWSGYENEGPEPEGPSTAGPESDLLRDLFWEELVAALQELPEEQRQVFIWNELEDIPFNVIAQQTGEKVSTLISRKRYAVLHLRNRLGNLYKEIIEQ